MVCSLDLGKVSSNEAFSLRYFSCLSVHSCYGSQPLLLILHSALGPGSLCQSLLWTYLLLCWVFNRWPYCYKHVEWNNQVKPQDLPDQVWWSSLFCSVLDLDIGGEYIGTPYLWYLHAFYMLLENQGTQHDKTEIFPKTINKFKWISNKNDFLTTKSDSRVHVVE
jgi:hypothetical protein